MKTWRVKLTLTFHDPPQAMAKEIHALEEGMAEEMACLEDLSKIQTSVCRNLEEQTLNKVQQMKNERKQAQVAIFDSIEEKCQPIAQVLSTK